MSDFVLISFFTLGTPYEAEIERLRNSCESFGLKTCICGLPSKGDWVRNCSLKGPFVRDQLETLKRPVLWVDADGEVVAPLNVFANAEFDLACYVRWSIEKQPPTFDSPDMPFMSGTVFINYTSGGKRLAELWARYCEENPDIWDQVSLARAWWRLKDEIRFQLLPQGYCKVNDRIWREPTEIAYILHYQASRRFKDDVKVYFQSD